MKSVTEFANFTINQGLKARAALTAEGKTPEEIQQSLGESFKYEGDKLKHFVNSLEVASTNTDNLKRVLVLSLAEGEAAPHKATQLEEFCYLPEFHVIAKPKTEEKSDGKGGRGKGGRKRDGGPKGSPWGLSPEEKAAKNNKGGAKTAAKPN